jgi:glycosyltransferase involved in cell wall biosynthesis
MNADILRFLKSKGHIVASAVWDHDTSWFLPDDKNRFMYETSSDGVVCELFPFRHLRENSSPLVYEIMKKFQPDIAITIGDYQETDFMFAIKSMYPQLFKWVSIMTIDALPLNENRREALDYADLIVTTLREGADYLLEQCGKQSLCLPYGPNTSVFRPLSEEVKDEEFIVMNCGKNSQASNTAAFIKAIASAHKIYPKIIGYLHTNIHDAGDYDIYLLLDRFKARDAVRLPTEFSGLNDGISDMELNKRYNAAGLFVDVSVRSATALTCLEAMATGCVPLVTNVGAVKEVVFGMDEPLRHLVDCVDYVGELEEEYAIASSSDLAKKIIGFYELWEKDKSAFNVISKKSMAVSSKYSRSYFLKSLYDAIEGIPKNSSKISVEKM